MKTIKPAIYTISPTTAMRVALFLALMFAVTTATLAQVQRVYVRSINRPNRQPAPIEGVTITVGGVTNSIVTNAQGLAPFNYQGQSYRIMRVQKQGYQLIDRGVIGRQQPFSSTVRQEIVMVRLSDLEADKRLIEERAYQRAQNDFNRRLAEIQAQAEAQQITQQEAARREAELGDNFQHFTELISDMAERYATMDYEGISDINRQILQAIENAELELADSLINSKGDINQRISDIQQQRQATEAAEAAAQSMRQSLDFALNDLAEDLYNRHTIFANHYQNDSAAHCLEQRAALDTTNVEWQNQAGMLIRERLANYSLALSYFQRVLRQATMQYGEQSDWAATSYNNIGVIYKSQGDYSRALEYYQKALEIDQALFGEQHPDVATSYNNIGLIYDSQGDYTLAQEYLQKALEIDMALLGEQHPAVAMSYSNIGTVYYSQGDYTRALEYYQKALGIRMAVFGEQHPDVAMSYNNIGAVYERLGDYARALEYHQKALEIRKAVFGEQHPDVATSYNNIGMVYYRQVNYARALEYYHNALEIVKSILGEQHPTVASIYNNIGMVYYSLYNYARAYVYHQKALEIRKSVLGELHPDVAQSYNNIGLAYYYQGDYAQALVYYQKAFVIWNAVHGELHPDVATCYKNICMVYYSKGDYSRALEYIQKALDIDKALLGEQHPYTIQTKEAIDLIRSKMHSPESGRP